MELTKVCRLETMLQETIRQFTVKNQEILVINIDGKLYGLDARCSHAGAPLEEGVLEGEVLTCPWHGSQFRINDGKILRGPAEKDLRTYHLTVQEETIFIEL